MLKPAPVLEAMSKKKRFLRGSVELGQSGLDAGKMFAIFMKS